MLNLISPRENEQIIENGEYVQSYYLTRRNSINTTGFRLPWLSQSFFIY